LVTFGFAQAKKPSAKKTQTAVKKISSAKENQTKNNSRSAKAEVTRMEELRKAEEAKRRQAALEAQRRREQAIREAQARRLVFERKLRTQTIENISSDITDGEDLEVRRAAINALGNRAGTVVVLEPQTGKVLTIVNQDWAIRQSFKPCSVIKLVTSVAGLNENLIDAGGNLTRNSFPLGLDDALAYSNNTYFQKVGVYLGNQKIIDYARILGLGEPTGLNVTGETGGKLPFGNNNLRIYSHGDDFEVTAVQLAVMVSALSNGGRLVIPQIPRNSFEKTNFRGFYRRQITLPPNSMQRVLPGMVGTVTYGTARNRVASIFGIAGKTGSCIGQGTWLGLFASVAPIQNPKLAVVVITRGQNERGKYAAAVAGNIYNALRNRLTENKQFVAKIPVQLKPQPKVNAQTSSKLDDADSEDSDEDGTIRKGRKGSEDTLKTSPKLNEKTIELFPTIVITPKSEEITRPRIVKKN
jgi:cell division protein FtsI/penicillin-binding protein 2